MVENTQDYSQLVWYCIIKIIISKNSIEKVRMHFNGHVLERNKNRILKNLCAKSINTFIKKFSCTN